MAPSPPPGGKTATMSASDVVRTLPTPGRRRDALLEQVALGEAMLDSIDEGIVACDRSGRVTTFNRVCRDFHGMDADATIDSDRMARWFSLYDTDGVTLLAPDDIPLLRALRGEPVRHVEIVIAPHGLPRRLVTCTGQRIHAPDGALLGAVVSMRDITARRAVDRVMQARALHDPLTGLANRDLLAERAERALSGAAGEPRTTALLFIDLDGFKAINVVHGHAGGDQLLRQVGERLRLLVRGTDTVARLGGDEFVVMCPALARGDRTGATLLADRLLEGLAHPYEVAGSVVSVSVSIGIAYGGSDEVGVDAGELIARADAAMYLAKRAGRDRHATYDHATTTAVREASHGRPGRAAVAHRAGCRRADRALPAGRGPDHRRDDRNRGAGPAERPARRHGAADAVRPRRRELRPDRPPRRQRAAPGGAADRAVEGDAECRPRVRRRGQHLRTPARRPGPARLGAHCPGRLRPGGGRGEPRAHRERVQRRRRAHRHARRAAVPGPPADDRRLRHRLVVAVVPAPLRRRLRQDRPLLRRRPGRRAQRPGTPGRGADGRAAGHASSRRVSRPPSSWPCCGRWGAGSGRATSSPGRCPPTGSPRSCGAQRPAESAATSKPIYAA